MQHGVYSVPNKTQRDVKHWVDINIGQCTCEKGKDGSPCSHQVAIVLHYGSPSVNCIPVMDPKGKQQLAYIAYGEAALQVNLYLISHRVHCKIRKTLSHHDAGSTLE